MAFPGPGGGGGGGDLPYPMDTTDEEQFRAALGKDEFEIALEQSINSDLLRDIDDTELDPGDLLGDTMWSAPDPADMGLNLPAEPEINPFAQTGVPSFTNPTEEGPPVPVPVDYFQQQRSANDMPPPPPRPPVRQPAQYFAASSSASASSSAGVMEPASSSASSSAGARERKSRPPPLRYKTGRSSNSARRGSGADKEPASKRRKLPVDNDVDAFLRITEDGFKETFKRIRKIPNDYRTLKLQELRKDLKTAVKNINQLMAQIKEERDAPTPETKAESALTPASVAPQMEPPADWQRQGNIPPLLFVPPGTGRECEYVPTDRSGALDPSFLIEDGSVSRGFETILRHLPPADATTLKNIHLDLVEGKFDDLCTSDRYREVYRCELEDIKLNGRQPQNTHIYYECSRVDFALYPFGTPQNVHPGVFDPVTGKHVRCRTINDPNFKYRFTVHHDNPKYPCKDIFFLLASMPKSPLQFDPTKLHPRELAALLVFRKLCWYGIQLPCNSYTRFPKISRWGSVPCFLFEGRLYTPGARVSLLAHVATCSSFGYLKDYMERRGFIVPSIWFFAECVMLHSKITIGKYTDLFHKYVDGETKLTKEQYIALGTMGLIDLSETHEQLMSDVPAIVQLVPAVCASAKSVSGSNSVIKETSRDQLFGAYLTAEGRDLLVEYDGGTNTKGQVYNASVTTMLACEVPLGEDGNYQISGNTKARVRALGLPWQEPPPQP